MSSDSSSRRTLAELGALRGRVAVITGGAGHIGRAAAETLAEVGAAVVVVDVAADAARLAAEHLRTRWNIQAIDLAVDLADANNEQLRLAGELAQLAGQPLLLVTVTGRRLTDHFTNRVLRERAHRASVMPCATR